MFFDVLRNHFEKNIFRCKIFSALDVNPQPEIF